MLTQLKLIAKGVTAPLPVSDDDSVTTDPIQIHNIDGLGPVAAAVNTAPFGTQDGENFTGTSIGSRNIVLTVGLNPNWANQTIERLRQILYSYFMTGQWVKLVFDSTHLPQVAIEGYVETMEPNMFTKDPEFQISIICPKPAFVATAQTALSGLTTAFTDPSTVDIPYNGDRPAGYLIDVTKQSGNPDLANGEVRIINNTPNLQLFSVKGVSINSSNFLRVSTVQGGKYAKLMPWPAGPAPVSLMGSVATGSIWAPFVRGVNKFQVQTATPGQTWLLSYYARYGGL